MSRILPDPYQQRINATVTGQVIGLAAPSPTIICTVSVTQVTPPLEYMTEPTTFTAPTPVATVLTTIGDFTPSWSRTATVSTTDSIFPTMTASFTSTADDQATVDPPAQTPAFTRTFEVVTS